MNKHIQQLAKQWYTNWHIINYSPLHQGWHSQHLPPFDPFTSHRRKPKIVCNNVQDGMLITVELPDVGELKVDVNTETKIINVNVAPDLKQFKALIESLPADLRPSVRQITCGLLTPLSGLCWWLIDCTACVVCPLRLLTSL